MGQFVILWGLRISLILCVFSLGVLLGIAEPDAFEKPLSSKSFQFGHFGSNELASPEDYISEDDIHVLSDKVVIDIDNPQWARFTDTNSMDPVLDYGTNAIQIIPQTPDQIKIGDIISYQLHGSDSVIIHRVISKGIDDEGDYFVLKGDNNAQSDPNNVRFSQIKRKVVALIY